MNHSWKIGKLVYVGIMNLCVLNLGIMNNERAKRIMNKKCICFHRYCWRVNIECKLRNFLTVISQKWPKIAFPSV